MTFVFRKFEMRLRFPRFEIRPQAEIFVDGKGINDLAGIHLVPRIPDGLEFAKCLDQFGTEHFRQHFGLRLAVSMLAGYRSAVADDQVGGILDKSAVIANAFDGSEIEVDPCVNTALPKMPIERAPVSVLFQELAQIAEI